MILADFPVLGREGVRTPAELADLLRATRAGALRLCGNGSSFDRLPPPARPALLVSTAPMDRIVRLEAGDLTCTVEPGVRRDQLDAELARHRLVLPCPGSGSLGGLLARGEHQPLAPGALTARNVVLGLEGVLTDGTVFKTGAQVVKSVAGFDLHRAFVGSRGRLFAATRFHLKLRPAPRARLPFRTAPGDVADALASYHALRQLPEPPGALVLARARAGRATVAGVLEGAPAHVEAVRAGLRLPPAEDEPQFAVDAAAGEEVVDAVVPPSALARVFAALPSDAPFCAGGTGQFLVALPPDGSDALLALLPVFAGEGEIQRGRPARRGRATPLDPGAARLEHALRAALDPRGLLQ